MNTYRSVKLKLPPQRRYDSDSLLSSSSVSSDNDDYAESYIPNDRMKPDVPIPYAKASAPRTSSFTPMSVVEMADSFRRLGYPFNFSTNTSTEWFTGIQGLNSPSSLTYNGTSSLFTTPKSNGNRKQPSWNAEHHQDEFVAARNKRSRKLNIDGVSFSAKDKPKSKAKSENTVKSKARKRAKARSLDVGFGKTRGCFICRYCRREFPYICHMKVHERIHTGEKPYSCKYCDHKFSQLGSLTVHMRIHTGAKPYQCSRCLKNFRHVNSLRRHQRQVHKMTSEEISRSVDKVKDASVLLENQLGSINQSVGIPPPPVTPFDFRSCLQLYGLPMQWYGCNGIWSHTYKNMFAFGQNNEYSDESPERMERDGNTSPATPSDNKSKPTKTWRPFEDSTDDEEDVPYQYPTEPRQSISPSTRPENPEVYNFASAAKTTGGHPLFAVQHAERNAGNGNNVGNSQSCEKNALSNSDGEVKEQTSEGYASMDEELSFSSSMEPSCRKGSKIHSQYHLGY